MKDELIEFETAKLAKEKGFNENSRGYYDSKGYFAEAVMPQGSKFNKGDPNIFSSPTQSLLQKWLREVHKRIIFITPKLTPSNDVVWYNNFDVDKAKKSWEGCYKTYEEALEKALIQGLKWIEN